MILNPKVVIRIDLDQCGMAPAAFCFKPYPVAGIGDSTMRVQLGGRLTALRNLSKLN